MFSEHYDFSCTPYWQIKVKSRKVKSRNTILIHWLWSKSTIKTPERCHVKFIFNFEHIQQINIIFLLLTLYMLWVGYRKKLTKQLTCALSNRAVSLKHVHVAWVCQHGLNKPKTIKSNVHMIIVAGL